MTIVETSLDTERTSACATSTKANHALCSRIKNRERKCARIPLPSVTAQNALPNPG